MSPEAVLSHPTVERVGWILIHFLWQGAVLAAMFGVEMALLRKSKANLRYLAGCLTLALMVLAPCLTMFMVPVSESGFVVESDATVSMPADASHVESAGPAEVSVPEGPHPEPAPSTEAAHSDLAVRPARRWKERAAALMEPALPYMVLGWLVGVFGLSVWHLGGWAQLQRLRRRMVKSVEPGLHSKLKELAELLGVRRAVALVESALVQVPTVVGWLKPVILLPASALTGLSGEQLEAVLAHELAHIRRFDYLVNMLQAVVEILGFYHPAVWWVSHKICVERENCCDDLAIGVTGDKVRYAKALTLLEEMRGSRAGLAMAAGGGSLLGRIRRLVGRGSREEGRYSWLPAAITVLLILAIAVPTTIALNAGKDKNLDMEVEGTGPSASSAEAESGELQERGEEILKRMGQVNRYWLVGPPAEVKNYAYDFILTDREPKTVKTIEICEPSSVFRNFRHGITYYSVLHKLVSEPASALITAIEQTDGSIRVDFAFTESLELECGNGLQGYIGYFSGSVMGGTLWLEAERMVPVRIKAGWEEESFTDYVALSPGHYVPLAVSVAYERTHYDWKFALHEPGLWLFEEAHYGQDEDGRARRVAWVENVKVNDESIRETNVPTLGLEYLPAIVEAHETQTQAGQEGYLLTTRTKDNVTVQAVGAPGRLGFDITGHFGLEPKKRLSIQLVTIPRDPDIWTEKQRQLRKVGRQLLNACGGFVRPRGVSLENEGHESDVRIPFVFMGEEDPARRIRLTVELKDGAGKSLATKTRECEDQRIYAREYNASHPKSRFMLAGMNDERLEVDPKLLERIERVAVTFEESGVPGSGSEGRKSAAKAEVEGSWGEAAVTSQTKSQFSATLSNGVTVELVGICEHPSEGKQWWRPEGSLLAEKPHDKTGIKVYPDENEVGRELTLSFAGEGADKLGFTWKVPGVTGSSARPVYDKGRTFRVVSFSVPKNLDAVDVGVGTACGKWKTVASGPVAGGSTNDSMFDRGVIFYGAYERDGLTIVSVAHQISEAECRLVAVDKSGNEYEARRKSGGAGEGITGNTYSFDLSSSEIRAFDLQARPYEWVEFRNVSLKPGVKTNVQIEVEKPDVQTKTGNRIQASPLQPFEYKFIEQVLDLVKEVEKKYRSQATHWPAGAGLWHVDGKGQVTVWHYRHLWRRSKDCAEDVVGWGSSQLVHALGTYYLPDGTPLQSRWSERGNGMKDIRVKIGRTIDENERVAVIHRHRLSSNNDLLSRDGFKKTILLEYWKDVPLAFIVRVDRPMRLDGWWFRDIETDRQDFGEYDQLIVSGPPGKDDRPMLFTVRSPEKDAQVEGKDEGILKLLKLLRAGAESGRVLKPTEERVDKKTAKERIAVRLAAVENHRDRVQRDLDLAERSLEDVRVRWGISDLEERSYPHAITSRLSRLQEERDNCIVEASRLEASIGILDEKVKAADAEQKAQEFKANLEKTRDELILLRSKLERLQTMVDEAEAKKKDLDSARAQYKQRLAVRDERMAMLDSIKEQIEKLRIIHDDPQIAEAPAAAIDGPSKGESARQERRLSREEIGAKLANLGNREIAIQRDLNAVERGIEEVRQRWDFGDLEERSYPHPVTARLMRLEQERDACLVEIAQLQAEINNLKEQAETADGKANLKRAQDDLVVLQEKYEQLQRMCDEAAAKKKDLDMARVQYKQRASVRDERKRMLDSIKEQIEKLRILHDDPETPQVGEREDEDGARKEDEEEQAYRRMMEKIDGG